MNNPLKTKILSISILIIFAFSVRISAQNLPVGMTPSEKTIMADYLKSFEKKAIISPPASPVRTMAEWEEIDALTITWTSYTSVLAQIVKYAQMECKVIINCSDSVSVKNYLVNQGVTPINVSFIIAPFNSVWIRDYGAQNVYTHDVDSVLLIDWIYNRPRPKDDSIPRALAKFTGLPLYETSTSPFNLINTGGNFMSDGFGRAFSSNLVVDENPSLTSAQIDTIMKKFMGLKEYIHMPNLPYDGIHHIDMHIKLLDEETLLVGEYPAGIADGPQIESNLQYILQNYNSVFGTPYKVVRIPMPPDISNGNQYPNQNGDYLTYTNSVFVNKTLLVPTYYEKYDTTALRILRESLPGYKVVGINCNSTISASGAIHCITNSVGAKDPLLISHQQHSDLYEVKNNMSFETKILHRSGIQSATLYYRWDTTQAFMQTAMFITDTANNLWNTNIIFPFSQPTRVYYYIKAIANTGKTQYRPMTAPTGTFSFLVVPGGVEDLQKSVNLSLFPNPVLQNLELEIQNLHTQKCQIRIYNSLGQRVSDIFDGTLNEGIEIKKLDVSMLNAGIFFLSIESDQKILARKRFVKM